jgi:hypothetical protein
MNRYLPYALVGMSVIFSIFGMADQGLDWAKIAALATLHLVFVKLLSGTLQSIIDESKGNTPKAVTLAVLGLSFTAFDVWLVHFGLELMLIGWDGTAVYAASIAFAAVNVFAHWAYTPTKAKPAAETLGENITSIRSKLA